MQHVFYSLFEKMCVCGGEKGGKSLREVWNFIERASIVLIKAVLFLSVYLAFDISIGSGWVSALFVMLREGKQGGRMVLDKRP